jgi:hypothetical protein
LYRCVSLDVDRQSGAADVELIVPDVAPKLWHPAASSHFIDSLYHNKMEKAMPSMENRMTA